MKYFSERERGERERVVEEIGDTAWKGIFALVSARIDDGSFAASYPEQCPDGRGPVGTDRIAFYRAMRAEIPDLPERMPWQYPDEMEDEVGTIDILDILEFCWRNIGKPIKKDFHSYYGHHHLSFDPEDSAGQEEFCEKVNRIFRRNGLVYKLTDAGAIERIVPPVLREKLSSTPLRTGDVELDRMLDAAVHKIRDPNPVVRRESLRELWDAWERLKTLDGVGKKKGIDRLLNSASGAGNSRFRQRLEQEATNLTRMGNAFQIRHSETTQEKLESTEHIDYLFHRMFSLIALILRTRP